MFREKTKIKKRRRKEIIFNKSGKIDVPTFVLPLLYCKLKSYYLEINFFTKKLYKFYEVMI